MKTVALGEVASFVRGVTFKPADVSKTSSPDLVGVLRTKNVQSELDLRDVVYIPRQLVTRDDQIVQTEDILISSANSWNLVGKCCWVPELATPYAVGGFITGLRIASRDVHARYLYRWLSSSRVQALLRNTANQTTNIANLNLRRCEQMILPLPTLDEQRRIAAILDHADALRTGHSEAAERVVGLEQSIFFDMFGDSNEIDSFVSVSDVCDRITVGVVVRPASYYVAEGVPALRTLNVKPGAIDEADLVWFSDESNEGPLAKSRLRTGDVVISRTGRAGVAAVVPKHLNGANAIDLIIVSPNHGRLDSLYLESLLNSPVGKRLVSGEQRGQIQQHFNVGSLKSARLPFPPLREQQEYADKIRRVRAIGAKISCQTADVDALFASLQSRAFSGQL